MDDLSNTRAYSTAFHYPDEEDKAGSAEFEDRVASAATELMWSLVSRLAQVESTSAQALWHVINVSNSTFQAKAGTSVSKQRMHTALKKAARELELSHSYQPLLPGMIIVFSKPAIQSRSKGKKAGPSCKPKR